MSHRITYEAPSPFEQYARCRCGYTTEKMRTRDMVEDEVAKHQDQVERIRLQLGTKNPTLKSQARYFREMADDPNVSPHDRRWWDRLATELEQRIGATPANGGEEALFDMKPVEKKMGDRT